LCRFGEIFPKMNPKMLFIYLIFMLLLCKALLSEYPGDDSMKGLQKKQTTNHWDGPTPNSNVRGLRFIGFRLFEAFALVVPPGLVLGIYIAYTY
jgi:hypothetical protein